MRRSSVMFKNLKAEMIRQDVTAKQIADTLDIKLDTARLKINGKIPVSIADCYKIADLFKENNDIGYLFQKDDKLKKQK